MRQPERPNLQRFLGLLESVSGNFPSVNTKPIQPMIITTLKTNRYVVSVMTDSERRVYYSWRDIKSRCFLKTHHAYSDYGERGISLADEFRNDFAAFFAYIGEPLNKGDSIDRIDNDKGYERGNLRWADKKTQNRNRRNNNKDWLSGEEICLEDIANKTGISKYTLYCRFKRGLRGEALRGIAGGRGKRVFEVIDGERLAISDIARKAGLKIGTVIARWHNGWRGKDLMMSVADGHKLAASKRVQNKKRAPESAAAG